MTQLTNRHMNKHKTQADTEKDASPSRTWSGEIVFFCCLTQISLASDDTRWMNSVQQLRMSSLASLATLILGMSSFIILLSAARGTLSSSSWLPSASPALSMVGARSSSLSQTWRRNDLLTHLIYPNIHTQNLEWKWHLKQKVVTNTLKRKECLKRDCLKRKDCLTVSRWTSKDWKICVHFSSHSFKHSHGRHTHYCDTFVPYLCFHSPQWPLGVYTSNDLSAWSACPCETGLGESETDEWAQCSIENELPCVVGN